MLALVATRKVGILLCLDASRLSRNSPDRAHIFHLCGHFDTLIADLGQVYDLSIPNELFGIGIMVSSIKSVANYNAAPLENKPATVIDERVKISGRAGDSSSVTKYFATL